MSDSPLQNETTGKTVTFEALGREWTVPTKKHLSHIAFMRDEARVRFGDWNLLACEAFLSPHVSKQNVQEPDQLAALHEIDPEESELEEFVSALNVALGIGSGNS